MLRILRARLFLASLLIPAAIARPQAAELRDFKGAIHVHSERSHDCHAPFAELAQAAESAGLDFVLLTDHFPFERSIPLGLSFQSGKTLFISGIEVSRGKNAALSNSILGIGILPEDQPSPSDPLPPLISKIREAGGLAVAAHPLGFEHWDQPIDAMEIYDLADNILPHSFLGWIAKAPSTLWQFCKLRFGNAPLAEILASLVQRPERHLDLWDRELQKRRLTGIGAPDAHQNIQVLGMQLDPYEQTLRFPSIHILAEELKSAALLKALRQGNAYTGFDLLADSSGFQFYAFNPKTGRSHIQGSEIPLASKMALKIEAPKTKEGFKTRVTLLRNGEKITRIEQENLSWTLYRPGIYRVEVELWNRNRWIPWIYSNPLYIR